MEIVKMYKKENGKIIAEQIDVNLAPHYFNMGWSTEKPKENNEKIDLKKSVKKEATK